MPAIHYQPTDRRSFLRWLTLGTAGLAVTGCHAAQPAPAAAGAGELHLALLSDTHIPADRTEAYNGFRPCDNLAQVVAQLLAARPEGVLINGDAARAEGKVDDYRQLKTLLDRLAAQLPVYLGLGNHDDRANFAKVFPAPAGVHPPVANRLVTVIEHPAARVIQLDSLLYTNKTAGFLGREQRAWLAAYLLQAKDRPVVLVVHHTLGDGESDLLDAGQLFALAQAHRHVKAVFYGHSHAWAKSPRERLHLVNLPALGYTFSDQEPVGWVDARFKPGGVSLTLHAVGGNRAGDGRVTELAWT